MCRRIDRHTNNTCTKIDSFTDGMGPVGISQRFAKKLRHCATITDGYTDRIRPVSISQRVAKKLRPLTQSLTDSPTDGAHSNAHDCQTTCIITDGFANKHGKSDVRVLWCTITDGFFDENWKIWRDFQNFSANFKRILTDITDGI